MNSMLEKLEADSEVKKSRIVIVDDTPKNIQIIGTILRDKGYLISVAQSGEQALNIIAKAPPDLILLDIVMPGMDGYETCRRIKSAPETKDIPVIFLTALTDTLEKVKGFEAGAVDFITKPVETEELLARIQTHLTIVSLTRKLEQANSKLEEKVRIRTRDLNQKKEDLEWEVEKRKEKEYIIQSTSSAIVISDLQGRISYANPAFLKMWGIENSSRILKKNISVILKTSQPVQEIIRILDTDQHWESEITIRKQNGNTIYIQLYGNPVLGKFGIPVALMFSALDITEIKQAEDEKQKLQTQLQQAQKMEALGTLAGGIAHDFNNILSPIVGYTEMIMDETPDKSHVKQRLEKIMQAALRAKDLVNQILSFSRQNELEQRPIKGQFIIKEALKLLRASIPKNIEIRQAIQKNCGMILADPIQIHQIIMNLCTNAYQAIPETGGVIEVALHEVDLDSGSIPPDAEIRPGRYVQLTVSDNGNGIEPAVIDRIFDPYFTTKGQGKGTGLGLSVIQGIIKSQGGNISVVSRIGKGSSFYIHLPLVETMDTDLQIDLEQDVPGGAEHILLVDDEEQILQMQQQMLERLGYHVTVMDNSVNALRLFKKSPNLFDIVISDMAMPEMTGDVLAKEMIKIRPEIPIVITTGFSESISKDTAEAIGVKGFLMKPVIRRDIAVMIRRLLESTA